MDWSNLAGFSVALFTFVGINLGVMQFLIARRDTAHLELNAKIVELERKYLTDRASLPVDYVRREDWIRISNTLEAKLDAMRAEMRTEHERLRAEVMGRVTSANFRDRSERVE